MSREARAGSHRERQWLDDAFVPPDSHQYFTGFRLQLIVVKMFVLRCVPPLRSTHLLNFVDFRSVARNACSRSMLQEPLMGKLEHRPMDLELELVCNSG